MASVLKPVDETRMFEKLGPSLMEDKTVEVSIIGYPSSGNQSHAAINLLPLPAFDRLSLKRFIIPWIVFRKINRVDPDVVVINTPELLFIALLSRIFYGRKIVYDVLENYYRTIRYTSAYPVVLRSILASIVRLTEIVAAPFVHHFLLAEKGYAREVNFAKPFTILQNKVPRSVASKYSVKRSGKNSKLLFTGTLAAGTGIFEAIKLCKGLYQIDNAYSLTIVGYCAIPETLAEIKKEINRAPFIKLLGGDTLVPHYQILNEISQADFGIIIYPPNPSTQSSIPTKLFEYMAMQLPVLIRHNQESHELVEACRGGIVLPKTPDYSKLSEVLKNQTVTPIASEEVFWEKEAENLISRLNLK